MTKFILGYARTSTAEQVAGLEAQLRDLRAIGCEKIFSEQVSSVAHREQLEAAIEFAREGDTFVVTSTCRLARSIRDLCNIVDRLKKKKVELRILKNGIDTSTPNGRLMLGLLGVIAEFEREILLERQREGVAKAQREGKYKGRAPTAIAKTAKVLEFACAGKTGAEIAKETGISMRSVWRILKNSNARRTIVIEPIAQHRTRPQTAKAA